MTAVMPHGLRHNHAYIRYRVSRVVSVLGSQLSAIAFPLVVLHLGGSAAEAGGVFTAGMLARVICQLPGGVIADRFDRRRVMIVTDLVRLAAMSSVPLAAALNHSHVSYAQVVAAAVVEGAATAAFGPSATAYVRELVSKEDLPRALAQTQGFSAAAQLAGPALGGLFFGLNPMLPFTLDAVSYGFAALLMVWVRAPHDASAKVAGDRRLTAGMRWLTGNATILRILAFASVVNLVTAAAQISVVVVLRQRGTSSDTIGLVMAAVGIGTVCGALFARRVMARLEPARLCLTLGTVWAAGFALFAATSSPWVIGPVLGCLYLLTPASGIMLGTMTLGEAPRDLLGRITTAQQIVSLSLATVGPLMAGALLEGFGPAATWLTLSGCLLTVTAVSIVPLVLRGPVATPKPDEAQTDQTQTDEAETDEARADDAPSTPDPVTRAPLPPRRLA